MQGLASVPADSYGSIVPGVRQVAPPSAVSGAAAYSPVHAAITQYQPHPGVPQQNSADMAMQSLYPAAQPHAQSTVAPTPQQSPGMQLQQNANSAIVQQQQQVPTPQQPYHQHYQQQMQQQQHVHQQPSTVGLPNSVHMNGHAQMRPQVRVQYPSHLQLRPVGRPPNAVRGTSVPGAAQQQQQQVRPHAPLAPVTPRRVSPMPFKLIAPNSMVRTIPATVQARLQVAPVGPRAALPPATAGPVPRPQVVMGVPAASRGPRQVVTGQAFAPGATATGVPVPGMSAPGRPMMWPPSSQPHIVITGAPDKCASVHHRN